LHKTIIITVNELSDCTIITRF